MAQEDLTNATTQYSQEFAEYQSKLQRLEEETQRSNTNYQNIIEEKRLIEHRLSESEVREREAQRKLETLRDEKEKINANLQFEQAGRLSLKDENARLSEKYDKLSTEYQSFQGEFASFRSKAENADGIVKELDELKKTYEIISAECASTKENLAVARQKIENEQNLTVKLQTDFDTLTRSKQEEHDRFIELAKQLETISSASEELERKFAATEKELLETRDALTRAQTNHENELQKYTVLKTDYDAKLAELTEAKKWIAQEESVKAEQDAQYKRDVAGLNALIEEQRIAKWELEEREKKLEDEHKEMLATAWQRHESAVEIHMHEIANKYDFVLCDKSSYPYQGVPDNAFLIGDMYTIFDAKSPKNPEDLEHFPSYLKQQAENMKKYCKNEKVRKDAFLVVPASTLDVLDTFMYPMADYKVYVITLEAVLPILQIMRVIESYEFAEQLSPEDRTSICKLIGRLSHTAKRKIQIDNYLSREMIGVLQGIGSLPEDVEEEVNKYEKEAKLNPPLEKRAKVISITSISDDVEKIYNDTVGWSMVEH